MAIEYLYLNWDSTVSCSADAVAVAVVDDDVVTMKDQLDCLLHYF